MIHLKQEKNVNIFECPQSITPTFSQISIGDLHANAMLMMFFLVKNNVIKITHENYEKLKNIYCKDVKKLTRNDIDQFDEIIEKLIINNSLLIRFIGDEICDRGQNDYFILKILDKLHHSGIKMEILLSNHSIEFLIPFEKNESLKAPNISPSPSLDNMRMLIENNMIAREQIDTFVNNSYLPNLKLISYCLYENQLIIYSHAGIGLETIRSLAEKFKEHGVAYKDNTAEDLANTIESINRAFNTYVKKGTIHTLARIEETPKFKKDPVCFLMWNRNYSKLEREIIHKNYSIYYVHGHDSGEDSHQNIFNLDGQLGKTIKNHTGNYIALGNLGYSPKKLDIPNNENPNLINASVSSSTPDTNSITISQNNQISYFKIEDKYKENQLDKWNEEDVKEENIINTTKTKYQKLEELSKKFLNMSKNDFNWYFLNLEEQSIIENNGIIMSKRQAFEGEVDGELFDSQEAFNQWKQTLILAKNKNQKELTSVDYQSNKIEDNKPPIINQEKKLEKSLESPKQDKPSLEITLLQALRNYIINTEWSTNSLWTGYRGGTNISYKSSKGEMIQKKIPSSVAKQFEAIERYLQIYNDKLPENLESILQEVFLTIPQKALSATNNKNMFTSFIQSRSTSTQDYYQLFNNNKWDNLIKMLGLDDSKKEIFSLFENLSKKSDHFYNPRQDIN